MGIFTSCCQPSASDVITPEVEAKRQRLVEAAEKRQLEQNSRGVADPDKLKRARERYREMEKLERGLAIQGPTTLRWTSD